MFKKVIIAILLVGLCSAYTPTKNHTWITGQVVTATSMNASMTSMNNCLVDGLAEWSVDTLFSSSNITTTKSLTVITGVTGNYYLQIPSKFTGSKLQTVVLNNCSTTENISLRSRLKTSTSNVAIEVEEDTKITASIATTLDATKEYFVAFTSTSNYPSISLAFTSVPIGIIGQVYKNRLSTGYLTKTVEYTYTTAGTYVVTLDATATNIVFKTILLDGAGGSGGGGGPGTHQNWGGGGGGGGGRTYITNLTGQTAKSYTIIVPDTAALVAKQNDGNKGGDCYLNITGGANIAYAGGGYGGQQGFDTAPGAGGAGGYGTTYGQNGYSATGGGAGATGGNSASGASGGVATVIGQPGAIIGGGGSGGPTGQISGTGARGQAYIEITYDYY